MALDTSNLNVADGALGTGVKGGRLNTLLATLQSRCGISFPSIWAHRGGNYQAPENSLAAWDNANAKEYGLEGDWRLTSDGAHVAMHDATVDRTTTGSGALNALTMAQARALDNGSKYSPGYATERVPTLAQFIARYVTGWLMPECSDQTLPAAMQMASAIVAARAESRSILQMFEVTPYPILSAVLAKYPTLQVIVLFNTGAGAPNLATIASKGIQWIGVDVQSAFVSADWVAACRSAGLRVAFYTVDTLDLKALADSYGYDAIFTGRPNLMARGVTAPAPLAETWTSDSRYMWGEDWMLDNLTDQNGCRPNDGNCGNDVTTLLEAGAVCIGRPGPDAASTWSQKFTVTCTLLNGDATRWAALQFCLQQDNLCRPFAPVPAGKNGYGVVIRQNGTIEIARYTGGVNSATIASVASTALVAGTPVSFRLDVTPTQLTVTRLDTLASCTIADATFRGGKFGLIWSNMAARFGPLLGV